MAASRDRLKLSYGQFVTIIYLYKQINERNTNQIILEYDPCFEQRTTNQMFASKSLNLGAYSDRTSVLQHFQPQFGIPEELRDLSHNFHIFIKRLQTPDLVYISKVIQYIRDTEVGSAVRSMSEVSEHLSIVSPLSFSPFFLRRISHLSEICDLTISIYAYTQNITLKPISLSLCTRDMQEKSVLLQYQNKNCGCWHITNTKYLFNIF